MTFTNRWWLARGLWIFHAVFAVVTWFNLPPRIPTHFGVGGKPDAWDDRSLFFWFLLVMVSLGQHGLFRLVSLPGANDLWNIPEKEKFLRLTPAQQQPVMNLMQLFGAYSAFCIGVTLFALHIGIYLVARGHAPTLPGSIQIAMFIPIAAVIGGVFPWAKAVRKSIQQASTT